MDLAKQKLSWDICDCANELVEVMDNEIKTLGKHESVQVFDQCLELVSDKFKEVVALRQFNTNPVVEHNHEILLLSVMTLKMSKISLAS